MADNQVHFGWTFELKAYTSMAVLLSKFDFKLVESQDRRVQ